MFSLDEVFFYTQVLSSGIVLGCLFCVKPTRDIFSPVVLFIFWVSAYFVLSPSILYFHDDWLPVAETSLFVMVTMCFVLVGYLVEPLSWKAPAKRYVPRKYTLRVLTFFPLIQIGLVTLILSVVGLSLMTAASDPLAARVLMSSGGLGFLFMLLSLVTFEPYILFLIIFFGRIKSRRYKKCYDIFTHRQHKTKKSKQKLMSKLNVILCLFFISVLAIGIISGSRGFILSAVLIPIIIYNYFVSRVPLSKYMLVGLSLVLVAVVYGQYRLGEENINDGLGVESILTKVVDRADSYPYFNDYIINRQSIDDGSFSMLIDWPQYYTLRSWNPDKPIPFQAQMTRELYLEDQVSIPKVTVDFTGIAEMIHSFGAYSVALLGILVGMLLRNFQVYYRKNKGNIYSFYVIYWYLSSVSSALLVSKILVDVYMLPIIYIKLRLIFWACFKQRRIKVQ